MSKEQSTLYEELRELRERTKEKLKEFPLQFTEEQIRSRQERGLPLLDISLLSFDRDLATATLAKIHELMAAHNPKGIELSGLIEILKKKEFSLEEFIKNSISLDAAYLSALSKETGVDMSSLFFIGTNFARPYLETLFPGLRDKVKTDNTWLKNICPFCGGKPLIAKLRREDGKRVLQCASCNTCWFYPRGKCPFCGNEDGETLRFFFVDEKEPYRVDVCDKCKGYIKTVDEKKFPGDKELDLFLENIYTPRLDSLAEREGYRGFGIQCP